MVDNSFRRMCCRKALRRLACEGRREASSQGESLRLQSCLRLRSQAQSSTSVCIQRFRLYTARLVQMLRTCRCPVPQTSSDRGSLVQMVARSANASRIATTPAGDRCRKAYQA